MKSHPVVYQGFEELAHKLPYFHIKDGQLWLDPDLGPVIDMHAHLALAYIFPMGIDLHQSTEEIRHFFPWEAPFSLETYTINNFSEDRFNEMERDLTLMSTTPWGKMRSTHTIPNLLREMKRMAVEKTLLLAIDYPLLSRNSETYLKATRDYSEFIVFGSVHPFRPRMEQQLDRLLEMGARGIKLHPAVQAIRPDHPRARKLYRLCGERDLPIFFHCGPVGREPYLGRSRSQIRHYFRPLAECSETTFILGHSGALESDTGLELAKTYPNVYLELIGPALSKVKKIVEEGPADRIFFGSDWPFYPQALTLVKVLLATEGEPTLRRKILYENGARFFGID